MIQLIVNAFVEKDKTGAVVEVLYASSNHEKVRAKYEELVAQYPENYLAIYDLPMDTDLNKLDHYPSVWIGKEEFRSKLGYLGFDDFGMRTGCGPDLDFLVAAAGTFH